VRQKRCANTHAASVSFDHFGDDRIVDCSDSVSFDHFGDDRIVDCLDSVPIDHFGDDRVVDRSDSLSFDHFGMTPYTSMGAISPPQQNYNNAWLTSFQSWESPRDFEESSELVKNWLGTVGSMHPGCGIFR
jgi:hypothetical protein